ncbi:MAG: hypothetical protein PW789_02480 [Edaphobacter sp.]|uniref:hypothetical protein n=1 Tax=Edaphobacter sp. TaxID=1934404 RepID=UPI00239398FC|nr:hypothetical protein [Edaphobacter sp.]MDE1175451.1 hypothetical protein [Edaphobacter sp.]
MLVVALNALAACAQTATLSPGIPDWLQKIPPRTWASDVTANTLNNLHREGSFLRYRVHIVDAKSDRVREVIESRDGNVARLILFNGKPLTPEQDKAERDRLTAMLSDPSGFAKHARGDDSGKKIADQLIHLMPEAMNYTYVPGQPQTGHNPAVTEIVIDFEPNPKFHPPTTTAESLTGLRGRTWIDPQSRQIVRMEGTIFKGINFGWGMLAHIYPGGKLVYEQSDAGNGRWVYSKFVERISVRALMVKSLNISTDVDASDFKSIPSMSYQEAIQLLLSTPLPTK